MTKEEILDGLWFMKSWKCNGDPKSYKTIEAAIELIEQLDDEPKKEAK